MEFGGKINLLAHKIEKNAKDKNNCQHKIQASLIMAPTFNWTSFILLICNKQNFKSPLYPLPLMISPPPLKIFQIHRAQDPGLFLHGSYFQMKCYYFIKL